MKNLLTWAIFFCLAVAFCVPARASDSTRPALSQKPPKIQYGIASYYDNKFEGRKTANGEIFTQKKLTAASNTLPLNCWVRVTNLSNRRMVLVRITDRMHPKNMRLIDLSRSAAVKLGYTNKGLTRVKVEFLGSQKPTDSVSLMVNK